MKKALLIVLIIVIGCSFINVIDIFINEYSGHPRKESFASNGTGWLLTKGSSDLGKPVEVNFSGKRSHYILLKTKSDHIYGEIELNGIELFQNTNGFVGTFWEDGEYFDAGDGSQNISFFIAEDAKSFILLFEISAEEEEVFDIGEGEMVLLIYPASSKEHALEELWKALPKSTILQRRLVELDWK